MFRVVGGLLCVVLVGCGSSSVAANAEVEQVEPAANEPETLPFQETEKIFETEWFSLIPHGDWIDRPGEPPNYSWTLPSESEASHADGVLVVVDDEFEGSFDDLQDQVLADLRAVADDQKVIESRVFRDGGAIELGVLVYESVVPTTQGSVGLSFVVVSSVGKNSAVIATMVVGSERFETARDMYEQNLLSLRVR